MLKVTNGWAVVPTVSRHNDLDDRIGLALGRSGPPRTFDGDITRAMQERRRQFLAQGIAPSSDTAIIQARIAAARREADEARFSPADGDEPDTIELSTPPSDDAA